MSACAICQSPSAGRLQKYDVARPKDGAEVGGHCLVVADHADLGNARRTGSEGELLGEDEVDADFGGVASDFAVRLDCFVAEFEHLAEYSDPAAFSGFGRLGGGPVQRLMPAPD
ncbi:hypothetical protein RM812_25825 [Streptomyces sp. DSM 40712]|uniref:Uncharacterized protein n=1 Tax=Streptomyces lancefieldiae TaxID=3075520 RepID=A0ABU3ATV7_9ACTN|nr:hypothetical protein [Streptomyces sp. DSM 40712]